VDHKSDTMANIAAVDACLDTRTRILATKGQNFKDVVATLAAEKAALDAAGLVPVMPPKNLATADDPNNPNVPADEPAEPAPGAKKKEAAA